MPALTENLSLSAAADPHKTLREGRRVLCLIDRYGNQVRPAEVDRPDQDHREKQPCLNPIVLPSAPWSFIGWSGGGAGGGESSKDVRLLLPFFQG